MHFINISADATVELALVAALFYTLCETAKLAGMDPHTYLLQALSAAIARPGAVTYPQDLLNAT